MASHRRETPLPGEVVALLGAGLLEQTGAGACRVVSGGGLVAKVGPPEVVAREAALLRTPLPVGVPALVDAGHGWLVATAEDDDDTPWSADELRAALSDLAHLHDAFAGSVPDGVRPVLRRPFSAEGAGALLGPVRGLRFPLPDELAALLHDPTPLLEAAGREPLTVLHGDPWPGNVLRPSPGRRVWIDWELASLGPAAADVASWLNQTPWHTGSPADGHLDAYLAARSRPVEPERFERALDAATVLWFLAYDVPPLATGRAPIDDGVHRTSLSRAAGAAGRVLGG